MKTYDAIIIGSGVSGLSAAYGLKEAGKTVLVVEEDLWGGTCPNRGCDPKKVLLSAVEARNRVKQLSGKGFNEIPTGKNFKNSNEHLRIQSQKAEKNN